MLTLRRRDGASVDGWGKENSPEVWRGRSKLDRHERAFVAHLRRTDHAGFDLALSFGVLDGDHGSFGERFRNDQHGSAGAYRVGVAFIRICFADDLNHNAYP